LLPRKAHAQLFGSRVDPRLATKSVTFAALVMPRGPGGDRITVVQEHLHRRPLWFGMNVQMCRSTATAEVTEHVTGHRLSRARVRVDDHEPQASNCKQPLEGTNADVTAALDSADDGLRGAHTLGKVPLTQIGQPSHAPHIPGHIEPCGLSRVVGPRGVGPRGVGPRGVRPRRVGGQRRVGGPRWVFGVLHAEMIQHPTDIGA